MKFIYSSSDDRAALFVLTSIGEADCCSGAVRIGRSRSGGDAFCTAHEIHAVKHDNPSAMRAAQFNIRSAARNFPLIRSAGMVLSHLNFVAEIEFRQHLHVLRSSGRCTASADCPQESPQAPASTLRTGCRFGCSFYYITSMQKMEYESRQRFDIGEKE